MIAQVRRFFFDQYTGAIPVWVVGWKKPKLMLIASAPIIRTMEITNTNLFVSGFDSHPDVSIASIQSAMSSLGG